MEYRGDNMYVSRIVFFLKTALSSITHNPFQGPNKVHAPRIAFCKIIGVRELSGSEGVFSLIGADDFMQL